MKNIHSVQFKSYERIKYPLTKHNYKITQKYRLQINKYTYYLEDNNTLPIS